MKLLSEILPVGMCLHKFSNSEIFFPNSSQEKLFSVLFHETIYVFSLKKSKTWL